MWTQSLLKDCVLTRVNNSAAAATTEIDSSILDMQDWDGVLFLALLNTVVDNCVLTLKAQGNTANSTSGMADLTGSSATLTAASSSNGVLAVNVYRPIKRYLRAVLLRTTQNATLDGIIAIQYRGRVNPSTQPATVLASADVAGV
jgi:hypothetical protein